MERLDEYDNEKEGMDKYEDERSDKNGITIIIHKDKDMSSRPWDQAAIKNLSILHLVFGIILFFSQIPMDVFNDINAGLIMINQGYVAGVLYSVTAGLGFITRTKKEKVWVSLYLVFSVLSSLWTIVLLAVSCCALVDLNIRRSWRTIPDSTVDILNTLLSIHLICSVIQVGTTIASGAMSCMFICCPKPRAMQQGMKQKPMQILSGLQIGIGVFLIICFPVNYYVIMGERWTIGEEIWCGIFFIVVGILGFIAARRTTACTITPFLVFNIMGSILAIVVISLAAIKTASEGKDHKRQIEYHRDDLKYMQSENFNCTEKVFYQQGLDWKDVNATDPEFVKSVVKCEAARRDDIRRVESILEEEDTKIANSEGLIGFLVFQIIIGLVEFVITVISAGLSCNACCCSPTVDSTAVYIPKEKLDTGESVIHVQKEYGDRNRYNEDAQGKQYSRIK